VLIAVTYVLVILYDCYNCGILRGIIGRLCRCKINGASLASWIHMWDICNSLIGAFATFLLLSYIKFLSVSADLLYPTDLYTCTINMNCTKFSQRLYYNASIEFFGPQHLPCYCCSLCDCSFQCTSCGSSLPLSLLVFPETPSVLDCDVCTHSWMSFKVHIGTGQKVCWTVGTLLLCTWS